VPTTAGSGTEATHFTVVYSGKKKRSFVHPSLLPSLVVLDPVLTYSLPAYQSAVSGMDVIAQAVESYWNKNATAESKQFAIEAIILWKEFFINAVVNNEASAREKMLYAAHLAGKAINITRTTGPHALSYYLTASHNIPHGHAVGLFLPLFFLYNNPAKGLCNLLGTDNANQAADFIKQKMQEAGLAVELASLGISKEKIIDELLEEINEERFANNPAAFDREKLKQLVLEEL
jgi:alcohol dehydrogenase class IV